MSAIINIINSRLSGNANGEMTLWRNEGTPCYHFFSANGKQITLTENETVEVARTFSIAKQGEYTGYTQYKLTAKTNERTISHAAAANPKQVEKAI